MADGTHDVRDLKDATDSLFVCALNDLRILLYDYLRHRSELICALAVVDERSKDATEEGMGILFRVTGKVVLHKGSDEAGRDRVEGETRRDRLPLRWPEHVIQNG